ncbi:histidine kinase [Rhodoferax sp.]|uniref:sensor histidine kinase n=1 Tax=Rhodoferax sp. TaxID=50421 RepID=UPI0025F9F316|nr:histidine kinase [Rhodoferax sp.]
MNDAVTSPDNNSRWARFSRRCVLSFHVYAGWLVSISWKRFFMLALLLIISMAIIHDLPPFSWTYLEAVNDSDSARDADATPSGAPAGKASNHGKKGVDISIDEKGVRITPRQTQSATEPALPASAASAPAATASATETVLDAPGVTIKMPPGEDAESFKELIADIRREVLDERQGSYVQVRKYGEPLMPLTLWFIVISMIIKVTYKGTVQAEAKAAQATEVAEAESLKRQVIEARMAAMQAQVEPHFLFNTLASIDHLIETDPPRASKMQKNLIALLRATMPTMREANAQATRDLGRELAMIRPYLEILKVRMEDRLQTDIRVSDGLLSAEFPPMMLQSLVENAIKHGLEPKADGGQLTVGAEIVHGKLAVTVADTGLGFGKAATNGTGIGLSNIRERLALLYGNKASLRVTEPSGGGTSVTITVPYVAHTDAAMDAGAAQSA